MACRSLAVTKTTYGASSAIVSSTPKPSTPGIWMSRNTTSGRERLIAAMASRPVLASPTTSTSSAAERRRRSLERAGASSSTMSARMLLLDLFDARLDDPGRDRDLDAESPPGRRRRKRSGRSIEEREPVACCAQPGADATRFGGIGRRTIFDRQGQAAPRAADAHPDLGAAILHRAAMMHRVLDERLENESRHRQSGSRWIDVDRAANAVAETRLDERQVRLEHLQLLVEPNLRPAARTQRFAQQVSEATDELIRHDRILVRLRGDGIERVEQEVRLKARAQGVEARGRGVAFQFGRADFEVSEFLLHAQQRENGDEPGVAEEILRRLHE